MFMRIDERASRAVRRYEHTIMTALSDSDQQPRSPGP
jgi:hypothetical protein